MNLKKILKIVGFIIGPLIPMVAAVYFLFPYINEEKHQKIAESYENEELVNSTGADVIGEDFKTVKERATIFQDSIEKLKGEMDSLYVLNDSLENRLLNKENELTELQNQDSTELETDEEPAEIAEDLDVDDEEFTENVKSLLSLDTENLAPIINEMSDEQIVQLYKGGNSLQRKKLLRSLKSERAAKLMTEVL